MRRDGVGTKRGRRFLVEGVNLGDGQPVRCWAYFSANGVVVRRYGCKEHLFIVTLAEAAGIIARRAQVLGPLKLEAARDGEQGPLFEEGAA
jgi:hypothetical protein